MAAFYKASVAEFLAVEPAKLMLELTTGTAGMGFDLKADQHAAWLEQAEVLARSLRTVVAENPATTTWSILLEYQIPGRPKRLDAVLLDGYGIIAVEFKIGADEFHSGDKWQLREYCWNLRDFHRESEGVPIAPVLVATRAPTKPVELAGGFEDKHCLILPMQQANADTLATSLIAAHARLALLGQHSLDLARWDASQTHMTRTVIEEAQRLFQAHDVREVSHAHADNTTDAQEALLGVVRQSLKQGLHSICFLTGVPGAGKTLVGLHAAYSSAMAEAAGEPACFASGNQPLLDVLHAALTLNRTRDGRTRREVGHELSAPVQNVHDFALRNLLDPEKRPPAEHVVVFDEAQRVWTGTKVEAGLKKRVQRGRLTTEQAAEVLKQEHSEPELLLRVMERCPNWCVVVALVGGGQEIYDGEAGLGAWGTALSHAAKPWTVWVAPEALEGDASVAGQTLFPGGRPASLDVRTTRPLHLSVAKRSPRAERYAEWVNYILSGQPEAAASIISTLEQFPIFLTRDFDEAKRLIREYAGETSRYGLVASSGAIRLRSDGVELNREFRNSLKYPDWFLRLPGDIRSSNQLEIAATEFECQGLELDWTCVCWGGDFIPTAGPGGWFPRYLYNGGKDGPHWRPERNPTEQEFVRNKYRVLLTRARFGTVIYIPPGDAEDKTRQPEEFNAVADYLCRCGLSLAD
jgi:hypothetical protein